MPTPGNNKPGCHVFIAALLLTAACVSHVGIDQTPCPCPDGFFCCATTASCMVLGDQCPDRVPLSSRNPCEADVECPRGELCQSWLGEDVQPAGPQECRRTCPGDLRCAEGEVCELAAHDSRPLTEVHLTQLCLPETRPPGCEDFGCTACTTDQIGKTFCQGEMLCGCFVAYHPLCGLTCQLVRLMPCMAEPIVPLCVSHSCEVCEQYGGPGSFFCEGNEVKVCLAIAGDPKDCVELCTIEEQANCTTSCQEDGGPRCIP